MCCFSRHDSVSAMTWPKRATLHAVLMVMSLVLLVWMVEGLWIVVPVGLTYAVVMVMNIRRWRREDA